MFNKKVETWLTMILTLLLFVEGNLLFFGSLLGLIKNLSIIPFGRLLGGIFVINIAATFYKKNNISKILALLYFGFVDIGWIYLISENRFYRLSFMQSVGQIFPEQILNISLVFLVVRFIEGMTTFLLILNPKIAEKLKE